MEARILGIRVKFLATGRNIADRRSRSSMARVDDRDPIDGIREGGEGTADTGSHQNNATHDRQVVASRREFSWTIDPTSTNSPGSTPRLVD